MVVFAVGVQGDDLVAEEARELMAQLGIRRFAELIGRVDLLATQFSISSWDGNPEDAEDLAQETFIKGYQALKTFKTENRSGVLGKLFTSKEETQLQNKFDEVRSQREDLHATLCRLQDVMDYTPHSPLERDCILKELRLRNWDPLPMDPASIDWIVLSHAHIDHTGNLPTLVKSGYEGPIYATPATREVGRLIEVEWEAAPAQTYPIAIRVEAYDRTGLLNDRAAISARLRRLRTSRRDCPRRAGRWPAGSA